MALAYFLGMCSFLACSKKVETAIGLGLAVVFVQTLTVPLNNLLLRYLLREGALAWISPRWPNVDLSFLSFILFIATIAAAVQVVEMAVDRYAPKLYNDAGRLPAADRGELRDPRRLAVHAGARLLFAESVVFGVGSGSASPSR
jgi:Na+-transporting NADH:ubiquinone oxidoreductase subunit E